MFQELVSIYVQRYVSLPSTISEVEPYLHYFSLEARHKLLEEALAKVEELDEGAKKMRTMINYFGMEQRLGLFANSSAELRKEKATKVIAFFFEALKQDERPQ